MSQTANIALTYFYCVQDERLVGPLENSLAQLKRNNHIRRWKSQRITNEPQQYSTLLQNWQDTDVVLFFTSPDFINTPFCNSDLVNRIMAAHDLKRLLMLPIMYRMTPMEGVPFKRVKSWPKKSQRAIKSRFWDNEDQAFYFLHDELKKKINSIVQIKQETEEAWQAAQEEDDIEAYTQFLDNYRSRNPAYTKIAEKKLAEFEEVVLWNKAQKKDNIKAYLHYLKQAPLKNNEQKAIEKIHAFEENEETIWADAYKTQDIALLLAYRKRFAAGKYIQASNELLQKLIHKDMGFGERKTQLKLESHTLHYYANQQKNLNRVDRTLYDYYGEQGRYIQQRLKQELALYHHKSKGLPSYLTPTLLIVITLFLPFIWSFLGTSFYLSMSLLISAIFCIQLRLKAIYSSYVIRFHDILTRVNMDALRLRISLALDHPSQIEHILYDFIDIENLLLQGRYQARNHLIGLIFFEKSWRKAAQYFTDEPVAENVDHPHWALFKSQECNYLQRNKGMQLEKPFYQSPSSSFTA